MPELDAPSAAPQRPLPPRAGHPLLRVARVLAHFGRAHRGPFAKGCAAALLMVGARLATPWPVHALMHHWKQGAGGQMEPARLVGGLDWSIVLGLSFLLVLATLGLADALLRLQFARFSIGTVRDLRSAALSAAVASAVPGVTRTGDLVARLVGDTARVKAGLKGFLVHVAPNGALFAGVTIVLLALNVRLGLIFGAAGAGTALVTILGARAMYRTSKKYRRKEGRLADEIDRTLRGGAPDEAFGSANKSSGRHEAALTRMQSLTTWSTYVVYGLAILAAIWLGTREIAAGTLEPRDMVLFLMYALIIRGPTVRLARQGSRLGKTVATANRVVKVLYRTPSEASEDDEDVVPLPLAETGSP